MGFDPCLRVFVGAYAMAYLNCLELQGRSIVFALYSDEFSSPVTAGVQVAPCSNPP